ncbi:MAG: alpha/beta fold hydrolase [Candidatus Sungbacteria bacterium]|nr:alpha/beta fold hydrolase [bacterium]MDZ4260216.1 alpha/beta fold hydrolase [Candidatus Sungbacteria bacterium]
METMHVSTKDGLTIEGDYYASSGQSGALLLHMMPADRTSWNSFAVKLQEAGFHVLTIDLRGHGKSTGGPAGYRIFSDAEHQQSIFDIEAAVEFLHGKGVKKLHIGGASIGANLAVQYAAKHPEIISVMLLSPGLDYHGIHTDIWVDNLKSHQAMLLVASDDDVYSFTSVKTLFDRSTSLPKREIKLLSEAGHGTCVFEKNSAFIDELVTWLKKVDE